MTADPRAFEYELDDRENEETISSFRRPVVATTEVNRCDQYRCSREAFEEEYRDDRVELHAEVDGIAYGMRVV